MGMKLLYAGIETCFDPSTLRSPKVPGSDIKTHLKPRSRTILALYNCVWLTPGCHQEDDRKQHHVQIVAVDLWARCDRHSTAAVTKWVVHAKSSCTDCCGRSVGKVRTARYSSGN